MQEKISIAWLASEKIDAFKKSIIILFPKIFWILRNFFEKNRWGPKKTGTGNKTDPNFRPIFFPQQKSGIENRKPDFFAPKLSPDQLFFNYGEPILKTKRKKNNDFTRS